MRCKTLWFFSLLGFFSRVLAAPSEKLERSPSSHSSKGVRVLIQEQDKNSGEMEDSGFWPTIELHNTVDLDYNEERAVQKKNEATKSKTLKESKKAYKSDHKIICEDKGKCSSNADGKSRDGTASEDSIDQLLSKIKLLLDKGSKTLSKETAELPKLISKLSDKVRILQKSKSTKCKNKNVAEIEERHTVETKILQSKEHHDKTNNLKDTLIKEKVPHVPHTNENIHPQPHITPPSVQINNNYLQDVTPEVNYNGGIPLPIDDLKKNYPEGLFPEDNGIPDNEAALDNAYYDDDYEGNETNDKGTKDYEDNHEQKQGNLTPDYLEEIIRQERNQNHRKSQHHVQEHELLL